MATRKASDSNLTGKKYTDASAGAAKVADVPQVPTINAVTDVGTSRAFNNGAATVTISAAERGGVPASYTVTSSPGGFTANGTSPVTVTGLQTGTSYTFTVTGTTATGTSDATAASNAITATTVPSAPTIGTVRGRDASIEANFTASNATGGKAITNYVATAYSGNTAIATGTGNTSPVTISGLSNGTNYTVKFKAVNANGSSAESNASNTVAAVAPAWGLSSTFTSSGNFTVPSGATEMGAIIIGGGASGGGGSTAGFPSTTGGNGGPGSYVVGFNSVAVSSGQNYAVTVGGTGGQSTFNNAFASPNTYGGGNMTLASGTGRAEGGNGNTQNSQNNRGSQSGNVGGAGKTMTISGGSQQAGGGGSGGATGAVGVNTYSVGGGGIGGGSPGGGFGGSGGDGWIGLPTGNNGQAGGPGNNYGAGGGGGGGGGVGNATLLGPRSGGGGGTGASGVVYVYTRAYASNNFA